MLEKINCLRIQVKRTNIQQRLIFIKAVGVILLKDKRDTTKTTREEEGKLKSDCKSITTTIEETEKTEIITNFYCHCCRGVDGDLCSVL